MNFTTKIHLEKYNHPIDYNSSIMLLGSCFAENMGEKFEYFKFRNVVNPFGIIFNAVSIEKLIHRVVNKIVFTEKDIFFHNDLWHCFEVHSQLSNPNKEEFLSNLNAILELMNQQITSLTHCIITLGTSWVYRNNDSNEIVANCHKVPQKEFTKELVFIEENVKCIQNIISLVHSLNPVCNFIFTVSPVRHIKDGFVENNVSKAHIISAIHTINHQPSTINYFPSYEIMMDELRDYRFYTEDMLHPSQTAIDYIWIKFFENYINQKEFVTMNQVCEIQRSLKHRPFNPNSQSHQNFLKNLNQKIFELKKSLPNIDFN